MRLVALRIVFMSGGGQRCFYVLRKYPCIMEIAAPMSTSACFDVKSILAIIRLWVVPKVMWRGFSGNAWNPASPPETEWFSLPSALKWKTSPKGDRERATGISGGVGDGERWLCDGAWNVLSWKLRRLETGVYWPFYVQRSVNVNGSCCALQLVRQKRATWSALLHAVEADRTVVRGAPLSRGSKVAWHKPRCGLKL